MSDRLNQGPYTVTVSEDSGSHTFGIIKSAL